MKRALLLFTLFVCSSAVAGGPLYVAGTSYFQSGLAGTPVTWSGGRILYYTDQGDLSSQLPNAQADQLVADAFSRWTSIATAAISATRAGSLDEDVNGTNVTTVDGLLTMPSDLRADAGRPVAIVYDAEGSVVNAILGSGAGAPEMCSTNSVYTTIDNFTTDGHIGHALIVINGNCATTSAQVNILRYRLARALGRVFGLDFSQLNDNVAWGVPAPTVDDYVGFPLMHPLGALCNEAECQPNADQPRMDDRAAVSRLYPITSENLASYPGKQVFRSTTARLSGRVQFGPWKGAAGQGMQGVNVVARLVDPNTSRISRSVAASSVSGFLFRGDAGNAVSGYVDFGGSRLDRFGSADTSVEGFYDLAGLEIPAGHTKATFELSVEPLNAVYADSTSVGPYKKAQVTPSGSFIPVRVTINKGSEVVKDVVMTNSAAEAQDEFEVNNFASPVMPPSGGSWRASLSGYGDRDYIDLQTRANRTFTLEVTALDENGSASSAKAHPVLGLWTWNADEDSPALRAPLFNASQTATTRLQVSVLADSECKLGITDERGDGRPDFRYQASLLYADDITPNRAAASGGTAVNISGIGFNNATQVFVGSRQVAATVASPNRIVFSSPALEDATYNITVRDPLNGATAEMDNVLHVGAAEAKVVLVSGSNPQVPVGTQAPNPIRVRVVDVNDGTSINGATVNFTATNSAVFPECGNPCSLLSDQTGSVSVYAEVHAEGASTITATLPNGSYVQTTVNGVLAATEIVVKQAMVYVASGSSLTVPVSAMVVADGAPSAGQLTHFLLNSGTATVNSASVTTGSDGWAASSVSVQQLSSDVNLSACVAPADSPCRTMIIRPVGAASLAVQAISGNQQVVNAGGSFAPISVRVTEASGNPVANVAVTFLVDTFRAQSDPVRIQRGEDVMVVREETVMLDSTSSSAVTDMNGVASVTISPGFTQPVRVIVRAMAGNAEARLQLDSMWADGLNTQPPPANARELPEPSQTREASVNETRAATFAVAPKIREKTSVGPGTAMKAITAREVTVKAGDALPAISIELMDENQAPVVNAPVTFFVDEFSASGDAELLRAETIHVETDTDGRASFTPRVDKLDPVSLKIHAVSADAEQVFSVKTEKAQCPVSSTAPAKATAKATSSRANQPSRSPFCTKAASSAASTPSGPRPGSTASSTAPFAAVSK